MFILRDLLTPLQDQFSDTKQGQKRKVWFAYTLLAVVVPFTSSITSNLLRALQTLFGFEIQSQRFYAFMASPTLPWKSLWQTMWGIIPSPATEGRILVGLDDSINPKSGKKIFGCGHFHDHAAKGNQTSYPWSQCILAIGLLKKVKSRWACLPLSFRFYMMKKDIEKKFINVKQKGKVVPFESKMDQAAMMLKEVQDYYQQPVLAVTDSWFGNNGLWEPLERGADGKFHLLSRMRTNITLYDFAPVVADGEKRKAGRPRKYGERFGSVDECAAKWQAKRESYTVFLYGKKREVEAYSQVVMLKTMKCPVRVVWVYRKTRYVALMTTDLTLSVEQIIEYYGARWKIGVSSKGHITQSVKVRPRSKDSNLVAWEAPWRETKTVEPSDIIFFEGNMQNSRPQRTVNADVASLHATPVAETVYNVRRQQGLTEMSLMRQASPAGYQRWHGVKGYVETGEALDTRRRKLAEEENPITSKGKWMIRYQGGGLGCSTADRRAAKRARREGPRLMSTPYVQSEAGVR